MDSCIEKDIIESLKKGDNDNARKMCKNIIALNPHDKVAYYLRGIATYQKGDEKADMTYYKTAILCFDKALGLDPTYEEVIEGRNRVDERIKFPHYFI